MLIRFRNRKTGTSVRVDEVTAERLPRREWERMSAAPTPSPAPNSHDAFAGASPEPEAAPTGGAPAGNASRGEWAAYAVSLGHSVDGLKRDEIRDLLASGTPRGAAGVEGEDVSSD